VGSTRPEWFWIFRFFVLEVLMDAHRR